MSLQLSIKNWKEYSFIWSIIQPLILKLLKKNVPTKITKLYENFVKYFQPAIDSLFKLKDKKNKTPNEIDNYCFEQGVQIIEKIANYLLKTVEELRK